MEKIIPVPTPVSQPYFDGCREGKLLLQCCEACQQFQFYPRVICSHCGGADLQWRASSGRGVVASVTRVRRPVSKAYDAPMALALIDLEEGVRMMAQVIDVDVANVVVGLMVSVVFEAWSEEITLPVFKPVQ